ncbi:mucin-5AC isoform X2 [Pogona vitticeps]
MGTGRGSWIPLWIPLLMIALTHHKAYSQYEQQQSQYEDQQFQYEDQQYDQQQNYEELLSVQPTHDPPISKVTLIPSMRTTLAVKAGNPAHNERVCSTWGNFHFKTFDGDIYYFPGMCNYIFSSHCKASYEDFNIQIRRAVVNNATVIRYVTIRLDGVAIELTPNVVTVNGESVKLPYSHSGILIERSSGYLKTTAKLGLELMWNGEDGLLLELNEKYANQTCGLCGDFNGIQEYNEFISNGFKLDPVQFGNMQKMDGPTEQCADPLPSSASNCSHEFATLCENILTSEAFMGCNALVEVQDYVDACIQDLCRCEASAIDVCVCDTFAEYSRQCAHAGGLPLEWRTEDLCPKTCPYNMEHRECGSPCSNTCTNPERSQLCEDHCTDGCFCPLGTVFDDINNSGCIALENCPCTYNSETYSPGAFFASQCSSCKCTGGQWACVSLPCPGMCSVEGGSHITTLDEKRYSVFGDCSYVLTKVCDSNVFTVLGEIRKCGLTDTETCLKGVAISVAGGQTVVVIKSTGVVYVNMILSQLPVSASNVTIFKPSSFFIVVHTNFGLQLEIQLVPIMQLFVRVDPSYKGKTCGLCGNFNDAQADDFKAVSGVVEGTSAAFANTWKTQADCPNIKNIFENPCTLSIENEKYASHWCGQLTDSKGLFQKCHSVVDPAVYHTNCMFDTCNCERSEDCMCAALSSYVKACAAKGVMLSGWRTNVCSKYQICPKTMTYRYIIDSCQPTCRSLSEPDVTCNIQFTPVDGCTCEDGTYLDENGKCVPQTSCPCYYKGSPIPSGESVSENGIMCTCTQGKLQCIGEVKPKPVCDAPMIYVNCDNTTFDITGAECQKSCQTLDMDCYSTQCVSGCVCPNELVSDGKGGCIAAEECPCVHNEATYSPGETIKVKCNNCTCKNRKWECTDEPCLETCSVYGDGHYITFDGKRYTFNGDCEYTLAQDHCGKNSSNEGSFRIITENIPCGTTGTTCSKAIKLFMGNYELILADEKFEVIQRLPGGGEVPFKIRFMGIYMVVDTAFGLVLLWDKKTSVFIKISTNFKGKVCGLCGNYDGNDLNDFTTRSQSVVGDVLEFGNSWKVSPACPSSPSPKDPCTRNPYRSSWAQKQCSIINSRTFASCHSLVEPTKYYEDCVSDSCACDTGGDCECFCTAVAAYAKACSEAGTCISWRSPSICPLFCDYYNPKEECEWHYQPCGPSCLKTCRNPYKKCSHDLQGLEGCYPKCPDNKPYLDEDDMECVALDQCGCFDSKGQHYKPGAKMDFKKKCESCYCSMDSKEVCEYDEKACYCTYDGQIYQPGDTIYNTTDGIGGCISATCDKNGTIERNIFPCQTSTPAATTATPTATTVFVFSSTTSPATTTPVPSATSQCVQEACRWSQWYDGSQPGSGNDEGDFDTLDNLRTKGYKICKTPKAIQCRAEKFPSTPLSELGQKVECDKTVGLICYNKDQPSMSCYNYQIRILCCSFVPCGYIPPSSPEITTVPSTPKTTTTPTTTLATTIISTTPVTETTRISTTLPTTVTTSTGTVKSTTETVPPTTEVTSPTQCKPICKWTEWYDVSFPTLDNKGDIETYDIIKAAGKGICKKPERIECRAEKFPEKKIDEIDQIVQCNVSLGLICRNEDQTGILQVCYNYQIKVYCCDTVCLTTTPETTVADTTVSATSLPVTTSTTTSVVTTKPTTPSTSSIPETTTLTTTIPSTKLTSTTAIHTTTTTPEATTETTKPSTTQFTTSPTTKITTPQITTVTSAIPTTSETTVLTTTSSPVSTHLPTTESTTIVPTTTKRTESTTPSTTLPSTSEACTEEVCEWSQWYDISYPGSAPDDGDFDTFKNIRAKGYKVCQTPKNVECRAERYPNTPLAELEQKVICSKTEGLICYNKDQLPPICYNYEIRIECCKQIVVPCSTSTKVTPTHPTSTSKITSTIITTTKATTLPETTTTTLATPTTPRSIVTQIRTTQEPSTAKQVESTTTIATKPPETTVTEKTTPPMTTKISTTSTAPTRTTKLVTTTIPETSTTKPIAKTTTTRQTKELTTETRITTTSRPKTSLSTTTSPPITTQKITTLQTSTCAPVTCQWSQWFDIDYPTTGPKGGDIETYNNIRTAGGKICSKPLDIQCRAENYPDLSIKEVGQVVECDVNFGLICNNADQTGKSKQCLNYEIRVWCCKENPECRTTPAPPLPTTTTTTTTAATLTTPTTPVPTTSTTVETKPVTTTAESTMTKTTTATTTGTTTRESRAATTSTTISTSTPRLSTTPLPTTTPVATTRTTEGTTTATTTTPTTTPVPTSSTTVETKPVTTTAESTTTKTTAATTTSTTTQESRAATTSTTISTTTPRLSTTPLPTTTPVATTRTTEGTTKATTTTPPTTPVPTTSTTVETKPVTTTAESTTTKTTAATTTSATTRESRAATTSTTISTTTPRLSTTPLPITTPVATTRTTEGTTTVPTTTTCAPITCQWSQWFDVDYPTSGPSGGDIETYNKIEAAGGKICSKPENIQCRAESHPDLSIDQLGQVVSCDVKSGLVCHNADQTGKSKQCLNYEIRVLCCTANPECITTPAPPLPTTTTTTTTTTTSPPTTPVPTTSTTVETKPVTTTAESTTTKTTAATTTSATTRESRAATTSTTISTTTPRLSTTPLPTTTPLATTTEGTTTVPTTTTCAPITCQWSQWFDVDYPTSGPSGGDTETYNKIEAAGGKICSKPENIQCRAESHPDLSIDQLGQVVSCDVKSGLVCHNADQTGKSKQCLNYEIRVLCCTANPECITTPAPPLPTTTTTTTTTTSPPTTPVPTTSTTVETKPVTTTAESTTTKTTAATTTSATTRESRAATTSTTISTTTPRLSTTPLPTTTPLATTTQGATTVPTTTTCAPITCQWSQWFDVDYPTSGPSGGDIETYNKIEAAGGKICSKPENIQCRAESHPDLSIDQLGQVVSCDVKSGLVCHNADQTGKSKQCLNYEIRVLCCTANPECITTPAPPLPTTTTTTTTTTSPPTTPVPTTSTTVETKPVTTTAESTTTKTTAATTTSATTRESRAATTSTTISTTTPRLSTTPLPTTTPLATTTQGATTVPTTTTCAPITCQWSQWFDVDYPTSGPSGGDIETYNKIEAAGGKICSKPENIQCRAESHPDLSIDQLGQVVSCDVKSGLVCHNADQTGKSKQCLNYEIRVLCCTANPECITTPAPPLPTTTTTTTTTPPTTPVPTTSTTVETKPVTTTAESTTTKTTAATTTSATTPESRAATTSTTISTTTPRLSTTPLPTTTPLATTTEGTTTVPTTTTCAPITCQWSQWFDVDYPTSGPSGGDIETYNKIEAAGGKICSKPENIQCRAESHPDLSIDQLGQVVSCDVKSGLVCHNADQTGKSKQCLNYEIRVLCCTANPECITTPAPPLPTTTTTTTTTTSPPTTPVPTTSTTVETKPVTTTAESTTTKTTAATTTSATTRESRAATTSTTISTTTPRLSTTPLPTTTPLATTTQGTTTVPTTTTCAPITCQWSQWFDVDYPTSGPSGGDIETYNKIEAAGGKICSKPENIQCRAESHPDLSIDQLGQVVSCDVKSGLVCHNADQTGKSKQCLNYEIRVLCCTANPECVTTPAPPLPTTTTTTTTTPPTTPVPTTSTTVETKPVTTTAESTTTKTTAATTTSATTRESRAATTSTTISTTTPRLSTTPLPTTTPLATTTQGTTTVPTTTTCAPITCQWSQWFDVDYPTSGPSGGDIETYNKIEAAGGKICSKPENIQCRAESHPDLSIDQLGQVVSCDVKSGLVCHNADQTGKSKQCLNYEIRVLCCTANPECVTTPATPLPTTTTTTTTTPPTTPVPTTSTTVETKPVTTTAESTITKTTAATTTSATTRESRAATTSTTISTTTPRLSTTPLPTTTPLATTTQGTTTVPTTTTCAPITCQWSQWFDVDYPTSGPSGGDIETYNKIEAAGGKICSKPENIQCRAESHPDLSIDQLGQVVSCDVKSGLVCHNANQPGKFKQCFNYEIRVLCCTANPECITTPATPLPTTTTTTTTTPPTTPVPTTSTTVETKPVTTTAESTTTKTTAATTTSATTRESRAATTSTTISTTTPRLSTTPLPTTTPLATTTQGTTTVPTTTTCAPITCQWSQWFDVDYPTSGPSGGDIETYNKIEAAGGKICSKPENIQCRAESHPDLSIDQLGQVVSCDVKSGLVCHNANQPGKFKQCFNYEIRVLCCTANPECITTPATPLPTTTTTTTTTPPTTPVPTTSTTVETKPVTTTAESTTTKTTAATTTSATTRESRAATTSTTISTTTPRLSTTPLPTTTPLATTTQGTTTVPTTTTCAPITCQWSQWFDVDYPTSGPSGGDIETYNKIEAAGGKICSKPENIQCRAESHPDLSIDQLGQVVSCDVKSGLVCHNADQTGKSKQCLNYEIRVLCCTANPECITTPAPPLPTTTTTTPPTTPVPTTSTTVETKPVTTTAESTTTKTTAATTTSATTRESRAATTSTTISTTTPRLSTTPLPTTTPLATTTEGTTTVPTTTTCAPITCQWSQWFDVDYPTSGPSGGDIETYNKIEAAGGKICSKPENIQCRAESHPDLSIDQLGQVVSCDVKSGLVCHNADQTGKSKQCLNYEIRVLCCTANPECITTPAPPLPTTTTTTTTTTSPPTTPVPTTSTTVETKPVTTTAESTTTKTTAATTTSATTRESRAATTSTTISTTTPRLSTTPLPTTTPLATTTEGTTTVPTTTTCAPITCQWSQWFDFDYPTSGPSGGDIETYNKIEAAGGKICSKPENIQCRAESHPDLSIDQLGQVVSCDVKSGLVCHNADQTGKSKQCLNYEIRVLCCTANPDCITTPAPPLPTTTTTTPPTTPVPTTSTTVETKPVTTTAESTTTKTTAATTTSATTRESRAATTSTTISTTTPRLSTTPLPTTTPLATTTEGTTTVPTTTTCAPITCQWSQWFDFDYPTSGPSGGDIETYNKIEAAGGKICSKPENIQCRAESHPDLSIDQLGQVVSCDVKSGLVCHNADQTGKSKQCLNYEIRVLCCTANPECITTPAPPLPTTATTATTVPVTTSVAISTSAPITTPKITPTATTPCFCKIGELLVKPGSTIYNKTDSDGCIYHAVCGKQCTVERSKGPCPLTTPKPTPTVQTTTPTTAIVGCPDNKPPMKVGETRIANCVNSTCEGNNKIAVSHVKCPEVRHIECANGYPPIKVFSEDGCCYQYQCECVCSGWGDPHYITFDGTYYTFLDNCTYVLVQQIIPKYDNFRVLIDNYFCDAEDGLSCPQSIIVEYNSSVVVLTRKNFNGVEANKIYFNNKIVNPGFHKNGIFISMVGVNMLVEIPKIGATMMFSGLIFSIKLPYDKFGNNTEGQCGTCTNDRKDDCRLPDGKITSCSHMAPYWRVPEDKRDHCFGPPPTPGPTTGPPPTCPPNTLCDLILSDIFIDCHDVIPPEPFHKGCLFDACHMTNTTMQCSGLEIYASLCASRGICLDWRSKTKGQCPYTCPEGKIYDPCGPLNPPTCHNSAIYHNGSGIAEGCFCPNGTQLFSNYRDICVSQCGCTGPDGMPKSPGETWTSNCQECTCEKYSLVVRCTPKQCPILSTPASCPHEGFVPVPVMTPEDKCCPHLSCVCNTTYCSKSIEVCPTGYVLKQQNLPGGCCINTTCEKLPGCVDHDIFYKPGALVSRGLCEECRCSVEEDPKTNSHKVECVSQVCNRKCSPGYEYKEIPGQCCGNCTAAACVLKQGLNGVHIIQRGETYYPPGNNCTFYECDFIDGQYVLVTTKKTCPTFDPSTCEHEHISDDGCCKVCTGPQKSCVPKSIQKVIRHKDCEASLPVELTYCEGHCGSSSKYSADAQAINHTCNCCQEVKTSKRQVTLICADGTTTDYSYIHVEECDCLSSECFPQPTPTPEEQQQQQQQQQEEEQQQQEEQQQEVKQQ